MSDALSVCIILNNKLFLDFLINITIVSLTNGFYIHNGIAKSIDNTVFTDIGSVFVIKPS